MGQNPAHRAETLLRDGQVDEALLELQAGVRSNAADPRLRVFLAQLLMVQGAWERALGQLQVAAQIDAANASMAYAYREAIAAERLRNKVFAGTQKPALLGEPESWMAMHIDGFQTLSAGRRDAEIGLSITRAFETAPQIAGRINGQEFAWLGDADMRLGPVFELLVNGRYFWVPGQYVKSLTFESPQDLRDLIWLPGEVEWVNGGTAAVFMPVRYPGSESAAAAHKLARQTDYFELAPNFWIGMGQRVLVTDVDEYPVLEIRTIEFDATSQ